HRDRNRGNANPRLPAGDRTRGTLGDRRPRRDGRRSLRRDELQRHPPNASAAAVPTGQTPMSRSRTDRLSDKFDRIPLVFALRTHPLDAIDAKKLLPFASGLLGAEFTVTTSLLRLQEQGLVTVRQTS